MKVAEIWLPKPPSTNTLFVNAGKKGRVKSKPYQKWTHQAHKALLTQNPLPRFNKMVRLEMTIGKLAANADVSNYIKAAEDMLKDSGVIIDDCKKWVKSVSIEWDDDLKDRIEIRIEEYD